MNSLKHRPFRTHAVTQSSTSISDRYRNGYNLIVEEYCERIQSIVLHCYMKSDI